MHGKPWIMSVFCCTCLMIGILVTFSGIYEHFIKIEEENKCVMTWMYDWPEYINVPLDFMVRKTFPKYSLFLYAEGLYAEESRNLELQGIPVLFIPGNAGSYGQVRSLASVALSKAKDKHYHFNYFTVDFDEELSVTYGEYLEKQIGFVYKCSSRILMLYKNSNVQHKQIIFIGHSMGGIVILGLFTLPNFDASIMNNVILLATPVTEPVVPFDPVLQKLYLNIHSVLVNQYLSNESILRNVTFVSIGGGIRDKQVRSDLISLENFFSKTHSLSILTSAIPKVQLPIDHRCIVWCNQLVLTINRVLFDMVDQHTKLVYNDTKLRMDIINYHFKNHAGLVNSYWTNKNSNKVISASSEGCYRIKKKTFLYCTDSQWNCLTYPLKNRKGTLSVAIHDGLENWLFNCTEMNNSKCIQLQSLSQIGKLVDYTENFRIVKINAQSNGIIHIVTENIKSRCLAVFMEDNPYYIPWSLEILFKPIEIKINKSDFFTRILLPFIEYPWDVYNIKATLSKCSTKKSYKGLLAQIHVPWFNEDITLTDSNNIVHNIQLFREKPCLDKESVQLLLWYGEGCNITVTIKRNWIASFAQLSKYNIMNILRWVTTFYVIFLTKSSPYTDTSLSFLREKKILTYILYFSVISIGDRTLIQQYYLHRSLICLLFNIFQSIGIVVMSILGLHSLVYMCRKICKFLCFPVSFFTKFIVPQYISSISLSNKFNLFQLLITLFISVSFCGSLGILVSFLIYYMKLIFYIGSCRFSVLCILLLIFCYSSMSLLAWFKELNVTYTLYPDSSLTYAIMTCLSIFVIQRYNCHSRILLTCNSKMTFQVLYNILILALSTVLLCNSFYICWIPYLLTFILSLHALQNLIYSKLVELGKLDKIS